MNSRDASSFLTGLILGAVVGLAIGFLYAPQSGKETREMLKEKTEVLKDKATEVARKVKQTAEEATQKVRTSLE